MYLYIVLHHITSHYITLRQIAHESIINKINVIECLASDVMRKNILFVFRMQIAHFHSVCHCVSLCVIVCHCVSLCVIVCHCVSLRVTM